MTTPEKLVVDASVAVKWYVPEADSEDAAALLESDVRRLAPDLLVAEFGNTLWKKVRRGELDALQAEEVVDAFLAACPIRLRPASVYLRAALDISTLRHRTVYDALYLAVALSEGSPFVTADARLVEALRGTELAETVRPLSRA